MDIATDKRPTLRSLAAITGLGISTVSQALRNKPEIAEETRRRVQLAAQQAGYLPNRAGVRLRTGKTNVISVILNAQDAGSSFFADFVYGVAQGLSNTSYHLVVTPHDPNDPMKPIRYVMDTASADGIIISRIMPNDPRVRFMAESGMPFATHGRTEMGLVHPYHDYDNEAFAYEAMRQLAERGRKRVALLSPPPDLAFFRHTHAGYERGLRDFDMESFPLAACTIDMPLCTLNEAGRTLSGHPHPPDGIVSASATAVYAFASGFGSGPLKIGKDFDVVSKRTSDLLRIAMPEIISIEEDFVLAGRDVAQLLIRHIDGEPAEDLQHLVGPPH
ncbi:MAG: LacI family transcriptional regulator [Proteobacteria bacterium]|nr:LacI family transcriptional regulator [Pseudomonadota bacterium]